MIQVNVALVLSYVFGLGQAGRFFINFNFSHLKAQNIHCCKRLCQYASLNALDLTHILKLFAQVQTNTRHEVFTNPVRESIYSSARTWRLYKRFPKLLKKVRLMLYKVEISTYGIGKACRLYK